MAASDIMVTYRYVRVSLVALVVFLLVSVGLTWGQSCLQGSISAFYYTRTHAVFLAAVCAIGICLVAYKGSRTGEEALLNFSGFMAFLVALIPTGAVDVCEPWLPTETDPFGGVANNVAALFVATAAGAALYLALDRWRPSQSPPTASQPACAEAATPWKHVATALLRIEKWLPAALVVITVAGAVLMLWDWFADHAHVIAAVAMFLAITLVAVYHACYARAAVRQRLARFYATIAALMLATVVVAVVLLIRDVHFGVFVVEIVLILVFAVFWAVQTWDVWEPQDRYPDEAVPNLAYAD
ncbi:diphosphate--fructose-6-phosphate 1-phosphotransferase [Mycolicibacterium wolinskyi]|uniref:Diphosphate--fructose-6-phosphate 1-phosphotransferase n=1 Tax=Mycolicibacterium wolinskyi TaxID=59750 RepID=A0A132PUJ1_9MYCO|nr:diphosphate--fructose-6-phosphate 1-phosphotransferase [Mycolicibacterium wolinskyi]KWX26011.1 diphosphate--fructose-6-phosphate 1-phosphotransferase [Mycolicibacterium wolinskyi]